MKKHFLIFCLLLITAFIYSCTQIIGENQYALPNLNGMSRNEIEEVLKEYDLEYIFYFDHSRLYQNENEYDKFIRYGNGYKAGSAIDKGSFIRIYTSPLHLTSDISDELKIDFDYEGKSFINDGVGEVTLVSTTDGDTARFRDSVTNETFRLRFLGIDTPESTITTDPWGKAASDYAANRLHAAKQIILESEGSQTDTYGRYLGWVWLDGKLYNLQVIQEAYSNSTCGKTSKYFEWMSKADITASKTGRRFFGELDPNYNYEN